ncbi:MAG: proprotein convertase P-domain-containing protein, partial [Candidatus Omnitrophica bacterium]|nr:proprotein convertase P-domain-containing protein [Candidatus Omnitrophota bacterium]
LNVGFTKYFMPKGGQLFLFSPDYTEVIGPFTERDNEDHGELWTPILRGDELVIEAWLPSGGEKRLKLELGSVNHGFRGWDKVEDHTSGACNVDVACPEGDPWRDQIRSSGVYSINGTFACSGALINNTAQDQKPYFLSAFHCGITTGNAPTIVVYWNYENSTCRTPGSAQSGQNGDGTIDQFNTGAILRAQYSTSDFALVELDDPISSAFNPYWSGWDRASADPPSVVAIHHPDTAEKRISFENDPTTTTSYLETATPGNGTHIRVTDWDLGTTEPGSSGSPLYSPEKRIVGQLHGGYAACGNNLSDWYGRLSVSWEGGGTPQNRLKNWLDPLNSGALTLDGAGSAPSFSLSITPAEDGLCAPETGLFTVTVTPANGFSAPVMLSVEGLPPGVLSSFSTNPVTPPGTSDLMIFNTDNGVEGDYTPTVNGSGLDLIRSAMFNLTLRSTLPPGPDLISPPDGSIAQTGGAFTWQPVTSASAYVLEIADNPEFNPILYTSPSLEGFSHTPNVLLAPEVPYFWRVSSENPCGVGPASETFEFSLGAESCRQPNLAIPHIAPSGVADTLSVSGGGVIQDLNVYLEITHTYVGDLVVQLQHVNTGTTVTLVDRIGTTGVGFGCDGQDIQVTLDDGASTSVEDVCGGTPPSVSGTLRPNGALSAFNGETLSGDWRLTVIDAASGDSGTLDQWCLIPSLSTPTPTPTATGLLSPTPTVSFTETQTPTVSPTPDYKATPLRPIPLVEVLKGVSTGPGESIWEALFARSVTWYDNP